MRKASWHKTKGCFGGAELRGPSKHPYFQEEMLSVNKELFIEPGSQKALFWGRQLAGIYSITMTIKEWLSWKEGKMPRIFVFYLVLYSVLSQLILSHSPEVVRVTPHSYRGGEGKQGRLEAETLGFIQFHSERTSPPTVFLAIGFLHTWASH